jgi:hypothetical protein
MQRPRKNERQQKNQSETQARQNARHYLNNSSDGPVVYRGISWGWVFTLPPQQTIKNKILFSNFHI